MLAIETSTLVSVDQPGAAIRAATAPASVSVTGTIGSDGKPASSRIVITRGDGGGRRVLANGEISSISPDGARVAVMDWDEVDDTFAHPRFELFSSAGGQPVFTLPTECLGVVWAPDSTKLACSEGGTPNRLVVVTASSGATVTIATGSFDGASFSPDSAKLVYVQRSAGSDVRAAGTMRVVDLATHSVTTLRGAAARPVWGPTAIAFSTVVSRPHYDVLNVALIQPDGSGFRRLTNLRPRLTRFAIYAVAWSADGTRLLAGIYGQDAWTIREAYAVNAVKGGFLLIAHRVMPTALSQDGRFVVGQTGDPECCGFKYSNIVRVGWAGGKKTVLIPHAMVASFNG